MKASERGEGREMKADRGRTVGGRRTASDKGQKAKSQPTGRKQTTTEPRLRRGGTSQPKRTARELALEAIHRVHQTDSYANILLPHMLGESGLSLRDRALATEIVYGTLRSEGTLDWIIGRFLPRGLESVPPLALDILRMGGYQLIFTERIPAHAACNESVKLAKKFFSPRIANFVNAVLRRIATEKDELPWPDFNKSPVDFISLKHSHPRWMVEMWMKELGLEETEKLCRANNLRPKLSLRVNTLKTSPEKLISLLKKRKLKVIRSKLVPEALIIEEGRSVLNLSEFKQGLFTVQDESSILVSRVVAPQAGETILDVCAAPGGKTTHLAQLMGNQGLIVAVDAHAQRLRLLRRTCKQVGVEIVATVEADGTLLGEVIKEPMDGVLVDAPCSGLGVLARRPDSRWRKNIGQIKELSRLQARLLESAAGFVKPGGVLVYSVCTISRRETTGVVKAFLRKHPEFSPDDAPDMPPDSNFDGGFQLLPHRHGTDGMFIARLLRS